ncbi:Periplasmic copper-binding protein (NosD) [uncultured archaeon]|nr:Periplasmic copper-binding protein (NosD) [uncultured archaeon]
MKGWVIFSALLLLISASGFVGAYSSAGSGVCICGNGLTTLGGNATDACVDCSMALGDTGPCGRGVRYAGTVPVNNYSGTCISWPFGFSNLFFDCQNNVLNGGPNYGIMVIAANNVTIMNCVVHGFFYGVGFLGVENSSVINCRFDNNTNYGIYLRDSSYNQLINNTADYNNYGIFIYSLLGGQSVGNSVSRNRANYNMYHGMAFSNAASAGNTLNDNRFCYNNRASFTWLDISDDDSNTGDNNRCDLVSTWTDTGESTGCTFACNSSSGSEYFKTLYTGWNLIDVPIQFA